MTDFIIGLMVIIWLTILVYLFLSELYFRSRRFKAIKRKIDTYTKECNESLKGCFLIGEQPFFISKTYIF